MEFLNKPMSEVWKSTKQTFSEIMDFNDSVIGRRQPPPPTETAGATADHAGGSLGNVGSTSRSTEQNGSGRGSGGPSSHALTQDMTTNMGNHSQESVRPRKEKTHLRNSFSKTNRRPVSEDICKAKKDDSHSSSETLNSNQQKQQNTRHSLNTPFGKINFRNLNMMNLTKLDTASKKVHHSKTRSGPNTPSIHVTVSRDMKPANVLSLNSTSTNADLPENEKSLRTHRTHSHGRSHQGSFSESSHFRSNSTDRASVMKIRERKGEGRHSYHRSVSDEGALSDQGQPQDEEDDSDDLSTEKMKTKFLSMWNNMKYGWTVKTRTTFSLAKPIWILGKSFQHRPEDVEGGRLPGLDAVKSPAMELFKREFSSLIWLTYRREFPQLAGSSYTTDCGWGCMLRSGQMMLAQALVQHFLGREWNYYIEQTPEEQRYHHEIVRWFGDQPDDMSPFSLHRLVEIGKGTGKKAGDWYGPASVAHIFKEAMDKSTELNPLLEQISVYVAQDCTIYKQDVLDLCKRKRPCSLQPVYSDQGSTSSPASPISPLHPAHLSQDTPTTSSSSTSPNPAHLSHDTPTLTTSFRTPVPVTMDPSSHACNHSAVIHSPVVHSPMDGTAVNGTANQAETSRQTTDQHSVQSHRSSYGDLNISHTPEMDPPPEYPALATSSSASTYTVPDKNHPDRKPPDASRPLMVAPKPKKNKQPYSNGNSPKDREQSTTSQGENKTSWNDHSDVGHHPVDSKYSDRVNSPKQENPRTNDDSSSWCAVVILVPVRLGGEEVNQIYMSSIQNLFKLDCCIGIIGGRPRHSLYYVGYQEEKLIHLDPHYCQPVVDMRSREFSLTSFHCMSPRKMAISKMDPSCTIGFYLRTEDDFYRFCEMVPKIVQSPSGSNSSGDYPMFILRDGRCHDWNGQHTTNPDKPERYLRVRHVDQNGQLIAPVRETEDFVFLDT